MIARASILAVLSLTLAACVTADAPPGDASPPALPSPAPAASARDEDPELTACRARVEAITKLPALPGAPAFEANRVEVLGRARGEPMVFVREPQPTPDDALSPALRASRQRFEKGRPGSRVRELRARHSREPAALAALLLREGYAYTPDPHDALAIVSDVRLADLFAQPTIWLQRGAETRKLERHEAKREITYRYVDGPSAGRAADLLFGDRVAAGESELAQPLHRDLRALAEAIGFDRARLLHRADSALLAELRFGDVRAHALIESEGAALKLGCVAEARPVRESIAAFQSREAPRLQALARIRAAVTEQVGEALRFDRPEGETGPDRDGQLRPVWMSAYLQGRSSFSFEEASYPVFDDTGKPRPPQVCVDFVLDTFERASGTWFSPRGEKPGRVKGGLDFDEVKIPNRRGVIPFGESAEKLPEHFTMRRFVGNERIPFGERSRFFAFLAEHADEVRPGDVTAIHGLKRDDRVHQHAILVEYADPITGFPAGLADQMKRPRRRTWEGIMAEAPKRSLYYRIRPTDAVFARIVSTQ